MPLEHSPPKSVRRFRRVQASAYLKEVWGISRSPKTLAKLNVIGGGPLVEYDGRIPLYTEPNLDDSWPALSARRGAMPCASRQC